MGKPDADRQTSWMRLESLLYALRLLGAPFSSPPQMVVNVPSRPPAHPQIISSLFTLPAITPLELSVFLLLGCYCTLVRDDYGLLERIINYCFSRIGEPDLQPAVAALFRSLCKDCGASITQNPDFVGPCVGAASPAEKLLQLHASIPAVMKSDDQCTVRPLPSFTQRSWRASAPSCASSPPTSAPTSPASSSTTSSPSCRDSSPSRPRPRPPPRWSPRCRP